MRKNTSSTTSAKRRRTGEADDVDITEECTTTEADGKGSKEGGRANQALAKLRSASQIAVESLLAKLSSSPPRGAEGAVASSSHRAPGTLEANTLPEGSADTPVVSSLSAALPAAAPAVGSAHGTFPAPTEISALDPVPKDHTTKQLALSAQVKNLVAAAQQKVAEHAAHRAQQAAEQAAQRAEQVAELAAQKAQQAVEEAASRAQQEAAHHSHMVVDEATQRAALKAQEHAARTCSLPMGEGQHALSFGCAPTADVAHTGLLPAPGGWGPAAVVRNHGDGMQLPSGPHSDSLAPAEGTSRHDLTVGCSVPNNMVCVPPGASPLPNGSTGCPNTEHLQNMLLARGQLDAPEPPQACPGQCFTVGMQQPVPSASQMQELLMVQAGLSADLLQLQNNGQLGLQVSQEVPMLPHGAAGVAGDLQQMCLQLALPTGESDVQCQASAAQQDGQTVYALARLAEESAQMASSAAAFCAGATAESVDMAQLKALVEAAQAAAQRASWAASAIMAYDKADIDNSQTVTIQQIAKQAADAASQAAASCMVHASVIEEQLPQPAKADSSRSKVPCKFFPEGRCWRGPACPFSHDPLDNKPRPLMLKREEECTFFAQGKCTRGAACPFAHGAQELAEISRYVSDLKMEKRQLSRWRR